MEQIPDMLIGRLQRAHRVVFATGAGISAESGVPTFRGEGGIWNKMRPEELASVDGFMRNPQLVWQWYQHRRDLMSRVAPNPGHFAIAAFEKHFPELTVVTQNIDGLHHRAGSSRIMELHGSISRNKCFDCGRRYDREIDPDQELPRCGCGGMIRPDVVWFGEMLPQEVLQAAFAAAEAAEVFFSVGTSAVVQPAASLPLVAARRGAFLVEVNLEPTPLTPVADVFLQGKSGDVLPRLLARFESARPAASGDEKNH
jgi:NAD-dependent deacetylase